AAARALGTVRLVEEDEIDVRAVVQLAAAELPHPERGEAVRSAGLELEDAVLVLEGAARDPGRGVDRRLGERRQRRERLGQRCDAPEVPRADLEEGALPPAAQLGGGRRHVVAELVDEAAGVER